MQVEVVVGQEEINQGVRKDTRLCPIARALLPAYGRTTVNWSYVSTDNGEYDLPTEVTDWIKRFDDGEEVNPIAFMMTRRE